MLWGSSRISLICGVCRRHFWKDWRRGKVTVSKADSRKVTQYDVANLRNVGIMAHIDAGKTTTTERFLYYSGVIVSPGEVHHGDTVTDFLPQERERGITIQSAAVSFPWKNHKINLIDTPGHVDFTFEVQRSLRVVDAAVTILDASAGVEAQTLTVWRQAADYALPRIIFLNKMDKSSASVDMCLDSISAKLKCTPLLLQLPVFHQQGSAGSRLQGVLDLVEMKRLTFDRDSKGNNIFVENVNDGDIQDKRNKLVDSVADIDSTLANLVIERESTESITPAELHSALRRVVITNKGVPVLVGSSFKNVGVQPLIDSILRYLPHPGEEASVHDPVVKAYGAELCAFAFKTIHDPQLGPLTFLRVFSGTLSHGQKIYNATRGKNEKIAKIYLPLADELVEVGDVKIGEVVIVTGLKDTFTGDTLTLSHSISNSVANRLKRKYPDKETSALLSGIHIPEPVFFCSIEPASISQQKSLEDALECLQREDPSLHVHVDPDTNQTVLSGMGELHLEIIHQRLKSEWKVDADLGKIQVAYKETITNAVSKRTVFERRLADHKHRICMELELKPVPQGQGSSTAPKLKIYRGRDKDKCENLTMVTDRQLRHIQNGIESAMRFGPKLGFPMTDIEATLHWYESSKGTSETIIEAAAASCFRDCLRDVYISLLEPVVELEVIVDGNYQARVLDDLNRRRFGFHAIETRHGNKVIQGTAPLSELMGYSTILRTISSGLGTFSMQFSNYELVSNPMEEEKIVSQVRGF